MRVDVETLRIAVSKAMNCVGKKGITALTSAITLLNDNGKLSLLTSTGSATLKVTTDISVGNFESCSMESTLFVQLLSKLEGEVEITKFDDRYESIKCGGGEYKINTIHDYSGKTALIPDIQREVDGLLDLNITEMKRAISTCRNACAEDLNEPIFYNIYFGNEVIATNDNKLIFIPNVTGFKGLINVAYLGLIPSIFSGDVKYKIDGRTLTIQDSTSTLIAGMGDMEEYPAEITKNLKFENEFEVEYEQIMSVLEKGKLFISPFDRNQINIEIGTEEITFRSNNDDFVETVSYTSPNNVVPVPDVRVNILDLYSILISCTNGPVTISCTEEGPLVVKQNDYQGMISLYE